MAILGNRREMYHDEEDMKRISSKGTRKKIYKVKGKGTKSIIIKAKTKELAILKYINAKMKKDEIIEKEDIKVKLKGK